jgi:hypothetical protein
MLNIMPGEWRETALFWFFTFFCGSRLPRRFNFGHSFHQYRSRKSAAVFISALGAIPQSLMLLCAGKWKSASDCGSRIISALAVLGVVSSRESKQQLVVVPYFE